MESKRRLLTKDIVLTALAAALLSAGKQALAAIPNVEVVTLLIMLYAACLKPQIQHSITIKTPVAIKAICGLRQAA